MLLERFVEKGRHVEIQVFADTQGTALHLFERDCSLQRRHQKVIEEAPAPGLADATRAAMGAAAVAAARAVGYQGAGTVEFLFDGREFYFLEMNTRLQVEHPVTEMITGLDLVEWQLRVAAGEPLPLRQEEIARSGHAVEARLYAEDPERGFLPSTGVLSRLRLPEGLEGVRVDAGVQQGDEVSVHYDPMIAKIVAWAPDRLGAIDRLRHALERTEVEGVRTNARFLWEILGADAVRAGDVSTRLLEQALQPVVGVPEAEAIDAWLIAAAVTVQRMPGDTSGVAHAAASPWQAATGFRMNSPATIRVALRLGDQAHWLEINRGHSPFSARPRMSPIPICSFGWATSVTASRCATRGPATCPARSTVGRSARVASRITIAWCCAVSACASSFTTTRAPNTTPRRNTRAISGRRCPDTCSTFASPKARRCRPARC